MCVRACVCVTYEHNNPGPLAEEDKTGRSSLQCYNLMFILCCSYSI